MDDAKVTRVVGLSSSVLFDKTDPQNPINRRISIVVMTQDAEQAALAGAGQGIALGKPTHDADTHVPDLSAAATATTAVGTPAALPAAGPTAAAPAGGPAVAASAKSPAAAPPATSAAPAAPRVSTRSQVASATALAKAAEAAVAAPRTAVSEVPARR
jgi:chemotaxis protein MotB